LLPPNLGGNEGLSFEAGLKTSPGLKSKEQLTRNNPPLPNLAELIILDFKAGLKESPGMALDSQSDGSFLPMAGER
jgi:hypothetical protein